jgi:hypothetical protein
MENTVQNALKYSNGATQVVWSQLKGTPFEAKPRTTLVLAYVGRNSGTFTTFTRASAHLDDLTVGQCCNDQPAQRIFLGLPAHGRKTTSRTDDPHRLAHYGFLDECPNNHITYAAGKCRAVNPPLILIFFLLVSGRQNQPILPSK